MATRATIERNGQQLASVRDLIVAYGGGTLQLRSSNGGRNVFYQSSSNIADIYTAQLYYRSNNQNEKRLDIYGDGKSASIGSAHFTVIDNTNYIPISYFQAFMCSNFEVTKVLSMDPPNSPDIYYYYEESGKGRVSMGYADIGTGLNFNGSAGVSETIASAGKIDTSENERGFGVEVVNAEAGFISADYEDDYWGGGVDVLHGEASASITTSGVEVGAIAELAGAEASLYIPFFNTGYEIVLTGEASFGGIGGEASFGVDEIGAKLVFGIGVGFNISIRKVD